VRCPPLRRIRVRSWALHPRRPTRLRDVTDPAFTQQHLERGHEQRVMYTRRWVLTALACCVGGLGCEPYDPQVGSSGVFDSCCEGLGSCVPDGLIGAEMSQRLGRDSCGEQLLCAPTVLSTHPDAALVACRAEGDLEGRCLPSCLPEVSGQAARLSQAECPDGQLCLPCFDPRSGEATGACSFGSDRPREPAKQFANCCEGRGRCVPPSSIPSGDRGRLAHDSCEEALCVPSAWLADPRPPPERCRALGDLEGRCLPDCLPDIVARAGQLVQDSCTAGSLCSPCYDPRTSESTGACETKGDRPREPAKQFARCCEGTGRCVPAQSVPPADRGRLAASGCEGNAQLCAPSQWLDDPRPAPQSCRAAGDREGRCLSSCLPDVAARAKQLTRATCGAQQLCVPCFDPISGEDTGVCRIDPDPGPSEQPRTLASCCQGLGRCVPPELIADDDRTRLAADSCKDAGALCVPSAWLSEPRPAPASCRAAGDLEGRCFASCLPEVAARASQLMQANCAAHELCLPCFDPLTGEDTQACRLPGDPGPMDPPREFEACCGELGRCLPRSAIDFNAQANLARESCISASDALCVPRAWIDGQRAPRCRAPGDLEGRCLPRCLQQVAEQGDKVQRADCAAEHACVPCFDPLSGQSTGACQLPGDAGPSDPPRVFERCCPAGNGTLGTCVPTALLPPGQTAPAPSQPLCPPQYSCVPDALVRTPQVGLSACASGLGTSSPGACVPECLLGDAAAVLTRATCGTGQRCVPCSQLGLETPACD
jgi:hypothetical protein